MRRSTERWLVVVLLSLTAVYAIAEELTLTTYYPSPRGVYEELRVTGRVGIGTMTPAEKLTVSGSAAPGDSAVIAIATPGTDPSHQATLNWITKDSNTNGALDLGDTGWHFTARGSTFINAAERDDLMLFRRSADTSWTHILSFDYPTGNVGIRTTAPTNELEVSGNVGVTGIITNPVAEDAVTPAFDGPVTLRDDQVVVQGKLQVQKLSNGSAIFTSGVDPFDQPVSVFMGSVIMSDGELKLEDRDALAADSGQFTILRAPWNNAGGPILESVWNAGAAGFGRVDLWNTVPTLTLSQRPAAGLPIRIAGMGAEGSANMSVWYDVDNNSSRDPNEAVSMQADAGGASITLDGDARGTWALQAHGCYWENGPNDNCGEPTGATCPAGYYAAGVRRKKGSGCGDGNEALDVTVDVYCCKNTP